MLKTIHKFKDKVQFVHKETDYDALAVKNKNGNWDVFVGLPPKHHYWMKPHGIMPINLDYSSLCQHTDEANGICHLPIKDKETKVWWVGMFIDSSFTAAHEFLDGLVDDLKQIESI